MAKIGLLILALSGFTALVTLLSMRMPAQATRSLSAAVGTRIVTSPAVFVGRGAEPGTRPSRTVRVAARVGRKDFLLASALSAGLAGSYGARAEAPFTGTTPVEMLVPGQKSKQRTDLYILMKAKIGEKVSSPYTSVMQLVLLDAITRDKESKTGGLDASIQYELDAVGLPGLKTTVSELKDAQKAINEEWPSEDKLSLTDVMVFAGYLKTAQAFSKALAQRSTNGGGATIAAGFGNPFPIPVLGRDDASAATGLSAPKSLEEIVGRMQALGLQSRDIAALAIALPGSEDLEKVEADLAAIDKKVAGAIKAAQQSRRTVTQNSYQVNVGEAYFKLVNTLGAKVKPLAYYYPAPKFDISKVKL